MAKANQAKNLADVRNSSDDPISELSDIMKFSPVENTPDDADSALEIDLESELLGELSLTDSDDGVADDASGPSVEAARATNVFGIPGLDEPLETKRVQAANDVSEAPAADAAIDEAFDDVFDLSMDDVDDGEGVQASEAIIDAADAAKVPPELENQLTALLAGLGDQPDDDEAPLADEQADDFADDLPAPDLAAVEAELAALDDAPAEIAEEMAAPDPVEDPLATLAGIVEGMDETVGTVADDVPPAAEAAPVTEPSPVVDEAPLVETADITDEAMALADDLDIPEVSFEHDVPAMPDFDELDHEFAKAFNKLSDFDKVESEDFAVSGPTEQVAAEEPPIDKTLDQIFADMAEKASPVAGAAALAATGVATARADDLTGFDPVFEDDFAEDPDDGSYGAPPVAAAAEPAQSGGGASRGIAIALIVAGIAVAGGIGAFALSFGGGDEPAAPAMVKADDGPIKVKPKDPGGKTVPNEDKAVYERVAGGNEAETPTQEKLITTEEEPLDVVKADEPRVILPGPADEVAKAAETTADTVGETVAAVSETIEQLPGVKSDDRILPEAEEVAVAPTDGSIAITPRRVKTLIVKPDGTLVPREEPVEAVTNELRTGTTGGGTARVETEGNGNAEAANAAGGETNSGREVSFLPPAGEEAVTVGDGAADTAAADGVVVEGIPLPTPAPRAEYKAQMAAAVESTQPAAVEPAPAAPKPAEPAAAETEAAAPEPTVAAAPPAAVDTEWWVQISSQPSREAAQASYAELAGRYGSIIGGRGVNIYRADIAGKGTYYRVRIAGGSRNEAAQLCSRLKGAGAGCFIAR